MENLEEEWKANERAVKEEDAGTGRWDQEGKEAWRVHGIKELKGLNEEVGSYA